MVSVIIVSFNTKKLTQKCLQSIKDHEDLNKHEIIVVDNHSQDGSVEMIKKHFSFVKLIANQDNAGFAKANNQGIKQAKGEFVLLLNSDTEFIARHTLDKLVKAAKGLNKVGVVVPQLLNSDHSVQASVFYLPTLTRAVKQYWLGQGKFFGGYVPQTSSTQTVEAAVMAAMLIPRTTLDRIGLLAEKYYFYFEDLDYCRRLKQAGLKVYYLPNIQVIHHLGGSGKQLVEKKDQWKRLIPSSQRYHGLFKYYLIHFVLWTGQKIFRK